MEAFINIRMDNVAFEDQAAELARIFRWLADEMGYGLARYIPIRDVNGNTVGKFIIKED